MPERIPAWRRPVTEAIQFHLGLNERQVGDLNAIDEAQRIPLARRMEAIFRAREDTLQLKLQPVVDANAFGDARGRLLAAYRDLETAEQVSHARRLSVLTADQVKKVSAFPARWPGSQRLFASAVCEGMMPANANEPRFLTGQFLAIAYSGGFAEAIECYRAGSLDLPFPGVVASGSPGGPGLIY